LDHNILVAYAIGLLLLYLVARVLFVPIRWILILVYNSIVGGLMLWAVNLVGGYVGFHLPLNLITAPLVGFLGVPGLLMLTVLKYLAP